jgi:hypothetical protein
VRLSHNALVLALIWMRLPKWVNERNRSRGRALAAAARQ